MSPASARVDELLREAAAHIGGDSARLDAELLLCEALDRPRAWLFAHATDAVDPVARQRFDGLVARRAAGEPVAHLLGRRGFWSLELAVSPHTLIPRPETERLVELALERLPTDRALRLLDLGTGTGAIALALASERPRAQVVAVERSPEALAVAVGNGRRSGLGNLEWRSGDWFAPVAGERFDLIASNPPYIAEGDPHLHQGDVRFEPRSALVSGADGLDDIRRIIAGAPTHLVPGGWLLLEHGHDQGPAVRALLASAALGEVTTAQDLESRDRISLGRAPL